MEAGTSAPETSAAGSVAGVDSAFEVAGPFIIKAQTAAPITSTTAKIIASRFVLVSNANQLQRTRSTPATVWFVGIGSTGRACALASSSKRAGGGYSTSLCWVTCIGSLLIEHSCCLGRVQVNRFET